jgi:hypothetical protein
MKAAKIAHKQLDNFNHAAVAGGRAGLLLRRRIDVRCALHIRAPICYSSRPAAAAQEKFSEIK